MKKNLFLFFVFPFLGFSQKICQGRIVEKGTGKDIEFANVGIVGKGIGTVTNEKGEFSLQVPDSLAAEAVHISMIGYKPASVQVSSFNVLQIISLTEANVKLEEVTVTAKKYKKKVLGNDTRTTALAAGFKDNRLGAEFAVKLNVKHKGTELRKFMVNITANTLSVSPIFRLNIYSATKDGEPGENILHEQVILRPVGLTGFIETDLTPYKIVTDNDVFVSLEWIKDLGNAKGLFFSTKMVGSPTYFRQTSHAKWVKAGPIGVGLHAEVAY
jgi:hypothetical protein